MDDPEFSYIVLYMSLFPFPNGEEILAMIPAGSSSGSVPLDAASGDTIPMCPMSRVWQGRLVPFCNQLGLR